MNGCRHLRWLWMLLGLLLAALAAPVQSAVVEPATAELAISDALEPPAQADWQPVALPDNWRSARPAQADATAWYRIRFEVSAADRVRAPYAIYLPYLYAGGRLYLNGQLLAQVAESDTQHTVRWERPHLVQVAAGLVREGPNVIELRRPSATVRFARPVLGPLEDVQPLYERRLFWMTVMPQVTVVICALMASFLLFIWWRRRRETVYGVLGAATMLWGIRTLTFVIEVIPVSQFVAWRITYHAATGGFIVMIALFTMRFAGARQRWLERVLVGYWLLGPLCMLPLGAMMDDVLGEIWSAGLIPMGGVMLFYAVRAAWQQHSWQAWLLMAAIALAVAAGVHDYLVAWGEPLLGLAFPQWVGHRIFLLHHAANLLLLVTAGIMVARFVETLDAVEVLNETLETRVAQREQQLARNYEALAGLARERAAEEERQRIMRDMHDGLGSQLLTSLSRVERNAMGQAELGEVLKRCIGEMRLALDALAPPDDDFQASIGNFRYRWEAQLREQGIVSSWSLEALDSDVSVPTHCRLHVLRFLQEALTNVVKHAKARHVTVTVSLSPGGMCFSVADDGCGLGTVRPLSGHGLENMRARARSLEGSFEIDTRGPGTRLSFTVPMQAVPEQALPRTR